MGPGSYFRIIAAEFIAPKWCFCFTMCYKLFDFVYEFAFCLEFIAHDVQKLTSCAKNNFMTYIFIFGDVSKKSTNLKCWGRKMTYPSFQKLRFWTFWTT